MRKRYYLSRTCFFVVLISLAGCLPKYAWKNFDSGKNSDAQLSMDQGECKVMAYQTVPAVAPQQNMSQNTYINTYNQGVFGNYNQRQQTQDQQRRQAIYQQQAQQRALNDAMKNVYEGCMSARGWMEVRVE